MTYYKSVSQFLGCGHQPLNTMKIPFKLTILFLLAFLLVGCNKNKQYKITGRILSTCSSTLDNNSELHITQDAVSSIFERGRSRLSMEFSTDVNGDFTIIYKKKEAKSSTLELFYNGDIKYINIPVYEDVDLGDVLVGAQPISFVIKLEVDSAYTQNDTLIYRNLSQPEVRIPGPFQSGVIDTVWNMPFEGWYIHDKGFNYQYLRFKMSSSANYYQSETNFYIPENCSNDLFEAVIKIE